MPTSTSDARTWRPRQRCASGYGHDPVKFEEFSRRYQAELEEPGPAEALKHLRELADGHRLRLLTATKHPDAREVAVLAGLLRP